MNLDKQRLINNSNPDANISEIQTTHPKLYRAIKNLGDVARNLTHATFPATPVENFSELFFLTGVPTVTNDVLPYRYHVNLPIDALNKWQFLSILLTGCIITAKIQGAAVSTSLDIKVNQKKGTTTWKSLFKPGFNPILPKLVTSAHNVKFAINSLFQDDLLRVDVLAADATISGVSLKLFGTYQVEEI